MKFISFKGHLKSTTALVTLMGILGSHGALGGNRWPLPHPDGLNPSHPQRIVHDGAGPGESGRVHATQPTSQTDLPPSVTDHTVDQPVLVDMPDPLNPGTDRKIKITWAIFAITNGDYDGFCRAVTKYPNLLNYPDSNGWTPLIWSVEEGQKSIFLELIKRGADVTCRTNTGLTAIELAANKGCYEMLVPLFQFNNTIDSNTLKMVSSKLNISSGDFLYAAAEAGYLKSIKFSLDAGADVNKAHDKYGWTPLQIASCMGHTEIVAEFLKSSTLVYPNSSDYTPLMLATKNYHTNVVRLLMNGQRTETDIREAYKIANGTSHQYESIIRLGNPDNRQDILAILSGPIILDAVKAGTCDDLRRLCTVSKTEIQGKDKDKGKKPKAEAVTYYIDPVIGREVLLLAFKLNKMDMVNFLVSEVHVPIELLNTQKPGMHQEPDKGKKDKNGKETNTAVQKGETLLMLAAEQGNLPAVKYLRRSGKIDSRDENGKTALMRAAQAGQVKIVQELMADQRDDFGDVLQGADPELFDNQGLTVLHLAVQTGNRQVIDALILPVSPQTQDKGKKTAKASGSKDRGQALPSSSTGVKGKSKVSIEMLDKNRRTPLMLAMELNSVPMITHLIRLGAQVTAPDGSTVLHLAAEKGWRDVYNHFLSTGIDGTKVNKQGKTAQDILNDRVWEARVRKADLVLSSDPVDGQTLEEWNEFKDMINCPIGFGIMKDPVFGVYLDDDKLSTHSYERADLATLLKNGGQDPLTRKVLKPQEIVPNQALKDEITAFMDTHAPYVAGMEWVMPASAR